MFTSRNRLIRANRMTLVELTVAITILAIASLGLAAAYFSAVTLNQATSEEVTATNLLQTRLAAIQADAGNTSLSYVYSGTTYKGFAAFVGKYLDSGNTGQTVTELTGPSGSGRLSISLSLNESAIPADFGTNLDLDSNGQYNNNLVAASNWNNLKLAPVTLTLNWQDQQGNARSATRNLLVVK